jgi:ketosteroid isomerase-like protein
VISDESASPDLVERVRAILDAANREDWEAILVYYAPAAKWETRGLGTFEGPSAIRGFWEDWWSSYEHLQIDVTDIRDLGHGVVLAAFHFKGPPKGTTVEARSPLVLVYQWELGTVVRVSTYFDFDEGREAAELLAEPGP